MNRKQLAIGGVVIVFAVLLTLVVTVSVVVWDRLNAPLDTPSPHSLDIPGMPYCSDEDVRPCVVSFGIDADDNMLVNILVPDLSYSRFYLKITYNGTENNYKCVRVRASLYSAYCIGEKMPPGETLHLMLLAERDDTLLAEGDLSIIGLALPAVDIVSVTPEIPGEGAPVTIAPTIQPTETSDFPFPTPTSTPGKPGPSTSTPTPPSYPNLPSSTPSYP